MRSGHRQRQLLSKAFTRASLLPVKRAAPGEIEAGGDAQEQDGGRHRSIRGTTAASVPDLLGSLPADALPPAPFHFAHLLSIKLTPENYRVHRFCRFFAATPSWASSMAPFRARRSSSTLRHTGPGSNRTKRFSPRSSPLSPKVCWHGPLRHDLPRCLVHPADKFRIPVDGSLHADSPSTR